MASVSRDFSESTAQIWVVLSDGYSYDKWVVAAADIRDVDTSWPEVGSQLHHTVGVMPIHFRDSTQVVEMQPRTKLVLRARVRPLGKALITFELAEIDETHTKVTMKEVVDKGLAAKFYGRLMRGAIRARNFETLRRLEDVTSAT